MRNPEVGSGTYQVDGAPGGAVAVRVLEERNLPDDRRGDGRAAARREAEAAASRAAVAVGAALGALASEVQDMQHLLTYTNSAGLGGGAESQARGLARQAAQVQNRREALERAVRNSAVSFAADDGPGEAFGAFGETLRGGHGGPDRLVVWGDAEFAAVEAAYREMDNAVRSFAGAMAGRHPWLRGRAAHLDRLNAGLRVAFENLRAARGRLRRPGEGPWPISPDLGGGVVGGETRLRLYALATRLTERTSDLTVAVAADPLLPLASPPAARSPFDRDFGGRGFDDRGFDGRGFDDRGGNAGAQPVAPLAAAVAVNATAQELAAALATGAGGRALSDADAHFERAWSAWQAAYRSAYGGAAGDAPPGGGLPADQIPPGSAPVRAAVRGVEEVHDALHAQVPADGPGGGRNGNRGVTPAEAAGRVSRSASALTQALPRLDLRALRGQNRDQFAAAAARLSAAAGYYESVLRNAAPGSAAERRARRVLAEAYDDALDGLRDLSANGRRDQAASLARDLLNDLRTWANAVGRERGRERGGERPARRAARPA